MKLTLNEIFHCAPGGWRGECERIDLPMKKANLPCDEQVRLLFRVDTSAGEKLVAKTMCADFSDGSSLYRFLRSWLGEDFDCYLDADDQIDLNRLVGRYANLVITHGPQRPGHAYPFVNIAGIYPDGTFSMD